MSRQRINSVACCHGGSQTKVDLVIIESLKEKVTDGSKKASQMKKLVSEVKSGYIRFRFYSNSPETFDCRVKVLDGKVESAEKFL